MNKTGDALAPLVSQALSAEVTRPLGVTANEKPFRRRHDARCPSALPPTGTSVLSASRPKSRLPPERRTGDMRTWFPAKAQAAGTGPTRQQDCDQGAGKAQAASPPAGAGTALSPAGHLHPAQAPPREASCPGGGVQPCLRASVPTVGPGWPAVGEALAQAACVDGVRATARPLSLIWGWPVPHRGPSSNLPPEGERPGDPV